MLIYFTIQWIIEIRGLWPIASVTMALFSFVAHLLSHTFSSFLCISSCRSKARTRHWILGPVAKKWWGWWIPCSPAGLWAARASSSPPDMWDQLCKSHWREFWEIEFLVLTNPSILRSTNIYWASTLSLGMCDALGTRQGRRLGFIPSSLLMMGKK